MASRSHFLLLLAVGISVFTAIVSARASDAILGSTTGKSAAVTQPHVTAELIPELTRVTAGHPFDVILHLHMDPGWHTYWINPGDAGLATRITWALPLGWISGPIEWPTPEKHAMGPLTTYGYGGDVYLLTSIIPPDNGKGTNEIIHAHATWLVCQEECIPGKADLQLNVQVVPSNAAPADNPLANQQLFTSARARLPLANTFWDVSAHYGPRADFNSSNAPEALNLTLAAKPGQSAAIGGSVRFFPEQSNVLGNDDKSQGTVSGDGNTSSSLSILVAQNGEKPDHLSGVLVSDQPFVGKATAVYLASFPVTTSPTATPPVQAAAASGSPTPTQNSGASVAQVLQPAPHNAAQPFLLAVLGAAFLGGLILNLMPCVLPVLSLKVFSLIRHAGENSGTAWRQGIAFTIGVVVSFWILAGLLLALRAAGNHLGWGFQMQSPGFVLALLFLFFLLGLNLFGVFELGASLVGVDAKASSHLGGLTSSFANGALATLAATPCTAPFMGSSIGFAAQQPAAISLLIFTFLALGMAAPYLVLTTFPSALRLVPKPGAWMEALRQFMGFLLMGTVIFLVYVFGALVGQDQIPPLLGTLLLTGFAAWIFGRWSSPVHSTSTRTTAVVASLGLLAFAIHWGVGLAKMSPAPNTSNRADSTWKVYSPAAVKLALAGNHPVFVDFTAAWCLSCKVNEQVALDIPSTRQAFADKHVALLRGDWTHSDPEISKTLQRYNRDGVPLYLLYSPKNPDAPQVLPEVLTPGIVQAALQNM